MAHVSWPPVSGRHVGVSESRGTLFGAPFKCSTLFGGYKRMPLFWAVPMRHSLQKSQFKIVITWARARNTKKESSIKIWKGRMRLLGLGLTGKERYGMLCKSSWTPSCVFLKDHITSSRCYFRWLSCFVSVFLVLPPHLELLTCSSQRLNLNPHVAALIFSTPEHQVPSRSPSSQRERARAKTSREREKERERERERKKKQRETQSAPCQLKLHSCLSTSNGGNTETVQTELCAPLIRYNRPFKQLAASNSKFAPTDQQSISGHANCRS